MEKLVPDTSVIVEGLVSKRISAKKLTPKKVIIHEAVLAELEHQANLNKAIGFLGLEELDKLKQISDKFNFELQFSGIKPRGIEIRNAYIGEIDSMIRDLAFEQDAVLFTADNVQSKVAKAKGIKTIYVEVEQLVKKLKLESYFDETTMSVHLRENVLPFAKKGAPGNWTFNAVGSKPLSRNNIQDISREIIEEAGIRKDGFIEIERPGSTIVQLNSFRIVITKPPFSDGWEITAVRPVKRLSLKDYELSEKLMQRISEQAEGILVAGSPGMGKSTFAQALAEFYAGQNKVVKTVEAPRDLVLPENVTQYAISHGDAQEIHDILLLSRPDYTIFDEMRNTDDFRMFADLRLAGIGLAGVVHATNPIDAIQRFVGRIELGVIPQVIDTVIFIKNGFVSKVLNLNMTVKVPSGMTEADLARPIVVVTDFETKKLEYELYSYGEETVVVPVKTQSSPSKDLAGKTIEQEMKRYASDVKVNVISDHKCVVYVPSKDIAKIIGKQGVNIERIEKKLGIGIDVEELEKSAAPTGDKSVEFESVVTKKHVILHVDKIFANKDANIFIDEDYLLTAHIGKEGAVKISRKNKIGRILTDSINVKDDVRLVLS
ncbi:MAG: Flp pilus assembly complex ATPase component [bacterium]|nr:Flp pilus assembly complex ATPase component [bacterium]